MKQGFVAAGRGSQALHFCQCVSVGVWQHSVATEKQLSLFHALPLPVCHVSVSPYTAISPQLYTFCDLHLVSIDRDFKSLNPRHHVNKQKQVTSS